MNFDINAKNSPAIETMISAASVMFSAFVGLVISHPLDRASFLAAANKRSFFTKENFKNPYQGFVQTATYKSAMGSPMYFFLLDNISSILKPYLSDKTDPITQTSWIAFGVGATHGFFSTIPLTVKSYLWAAPDAKTFWIQNFLKIYQTAGSKRLYSAMPAIVGRDALNALVYEYVRQKVKSHENKVFLFKYHFLCNALGAMTAIVCSSLFNYIRQLQLATPLNEQPKTGIQLLKELYVESKNNKAIAEQSMFIIKRLQLPISLLRFGFLIPVFQESYLFCKDQIHQKLENHQKMYP